MEENAIASTRILIWKITSTTTTTALAFKYVNMKMIINTDLFIF